MCSAHRGGGGRVKTRADYYRKAGKHVTTAALPNDLHEEVRRLADREGVSAGTVVFWAVRAYINQKLDLETQDLAS